MERKPVAKMLVGSHNYNLHNENSDRDYKLFVLPTYDDLYHGTTDHFKTKSSITNTEDVEVHDVRRLPHLLDKANVNFIETLFSVSRTTWDETTYYTDQLFAMREELARMNLPYLYNASFGMFIEQKKKWEKGDYTDHKKAYQALRILDFLVRYERNKFESFGQAIYYEASDPMRSYLLKAKAGEVSMGDMNVSLANYENHVKLIRTSYMSHERNEETKKRLDKLVYEMVAIEIENEFMRKKDESILF